MICSRSPRRRRSFRSCSSGASCASWRSGRLLPVSSEAALDLRDRVRDVPDFPKPGIVFKDLMPLVADAVYFRETIDRLAELAGPRQPDIILGAEARGFIFGGARRPARLRLRAGPQAGQAAVGDRRGDVRPRVRHRGVGLQLGEVAHDQRLIAERLEGRQRRRELEAPSARRRRPLLHDGPVRHVDEAEAADGPGGGLGENGQRGHHRVEERQRQRGSDAAQERSPRQRHPRDHHDGDLLIWNDGLVTMPMTTLDSRYSCCAAMRVTARTAGAS